MHISLRAARRRAGLLAPTGLTRIGTPAAERQHLSQVASKHDTENNVKQCAAALTRFFNARQGLQAILHCQLPWPTSQILINAACQCMCL